MLILPDFEPIPSPDSDRYDKFVVHQTILQSGNLTSLQMPNPCQTVSPQQSGSIHQDQLKTDKTSFNNKYSEVDESLPWK